MKDEPQSSIEAARERQVPEDLLQKLHDATERFHQVKKLLDAAMEETETRHQKTIDKATEDLRTAERAVEEITMQIHSSLKPPPPMQANH